MKFRPMFEGPLLLGEKTCTSRTKKMGNPGDRFVAFGGEFELTSVKDVSLYEVSLLWKEDGCMSREHFIEVWKSIYPRTGYRDGQRVYLHEFKLLGPENDPEELDEHWGNHDDRNDGSVEIEP